MYQITPQNANPGNRLIHSRRKNTLSARHARYTTRIEPKPRRLCADGLPLSTSSSVCANGARTKEIGAKRYQKTTSISTHIIAGRPGGLVVTLECY